VTSGIDDEDLRRGVQLIDLASREVDRIAQFVRFALVASVTDDQRIAGPDEIAEAARAQSAAERGHLHILELATGTYRDLGEELRVESDATRFLEISADVVRTGDVDVAGMLEAISISDDESYYGFLHDVSNELRERADRLNNAALSRQRWFMALAWLALAVALVATPLMTRSITRPLRSLTRQAKDVAERRLPQAVLGVHETPLGDDVEAPELEPVSVAGRDEVADVAAMLNRVQSRALELAVGQAVLRRNVADAFANLARRNQSLLGRQLDFITELEADEARPDALASLFRLDHHATRMRRNAESLLVLAGAEQRRHVTAPARLMDVVRAALSEVDDFPRVAFRNVAPATVAGPAVADLAHLLAELIENALRFSPPDRPVEISGQARADGYLVTIADSGLGMGPDEIARANRRLAQAEDFTIAPSRYLGHYVAAALAARHGVGVALHPSPLSGITATVHLPSLLLVADPGAGAGVDPGPEAMARPGRVTAVRAALSGAGSGTRPRVEAGAAGFDRQGAGGVAVAERPRSSRAGDLYRLLTDLSAGVRRGQQDLGGGVVPGR
jgi:signal transduction histidine kinase